MKIKSKLKEIMTSTGMTYKRLETMTGVSSQTITRARGPQISECRLSTLASIAEALNVSTKDLYEEEIQKDKKL